MLGIGVAAIVLAMLVLAGCGGDDISRAQVVGAMTDERVPDRYDELDASAADLATEAATFCTGDRSDPTSLLDAVTVVREQWVALRPFWFGPGMDRRSRNYIDWPVDADDVASLVAGDAPVDAESLRQLVGADQRGLGAIEVLASQPDDRACSYIIGSVALIQEETAELAAAWDTFGSTLSTNDDAANGALSDIVSESLFALPSTGSDNPRADASLAGVRWAILGDGDAVAGIAPLLDDEVVAQLTTEFDAVAANHTFEAVMALERTIKTNVAGDLGITVKFSDADGDG